MQTLLAYLDAGSGSMIAQILVGGFAAAGVAIKMYWKKINSFLSRGDDEASPATAKVTEASADEPKNS
ncbi:MAG: hypothetical protein ACKOFC_02500 [Solirubrobacterales bacterium]